MRRPALAGLVAAGLTLIPACTGDVGPPLLLLPPDGGDLAAVSPSVLEDTLGEAAADLPDVRSATTIEAVPGAADDGCTAEGWTGEPEDAPVLALPGIGYTRVRTADSAGGQTTVVCDYDADGELLVVDDLRTTGTDRPVGNDYVTRAGTIAGRVDVGIPPTAVLAVQQLGGWSLLVPLEDDMAVLRLHALEGGSTDDGFDVGTVRFFDADGVDVTEASVPIPDVIHGVPRDRGSAVGG